MVSFKSSTLTLPEVGKHAVGRVCDPRLEGLTTRSLRNNRRRKPGLAIVCGNHCHKLSGNRHSNGITSRRTLIGRQSKLRKSRHCLRFEVKPEGIGT